MPCFAPQVGLAYLEGLMIVEDSQIINTTATDGNMGCIGIAGGSLVLRRSHITNSYAAGDYGTIAVAGIISISNSTFVDCAAASG